MIEKYDLTDASDESRIAAVIRCVLHIDPFQLTDEEFYQAWGQVKFFTSLAYQIKWDK